MGNGHRYMSRVHSIIHTSNVSCELQAGRQSNDGKHIGRDLVADAKLGDEDRNALKAMLKSGRLKVSPDEWLQMFEHWHVDFEEADTNKDGQLDEEEWVAKYGSTEGFIEFDLDGSGQVAPRLPAIVLCYCSRYSTDLLLALHLSLHFSLQTLYLLHCRLHY